MILVVKSDNWKVLIVLYVLLDLYDLKMLILESPQKI